MLSQNAIGPRTIKTNKVKNKSLPVMETKKSIGKLIIISLS